MAVGVLCEGGDVLSDASACLMLVETSRSQRMLNCGGTVCCKIAGKVRCSLALDRLVAFGRLLLREVHVQARYDCAQAACAVHRAICGRNDSLLGDVCSIQSMLEVYLLAT